MRPTPAPVPTKAQAELLAWMVESPEAEYSGGSLIAFYKARKNAEIRAGMEARGEREEWIRTMTENTRGGYADHGFRRSGGTALANLAKRGFVVHTSTHYGTPYYVLTPLGIQAERQYRILPGEVRWFPGGPEFARKVIRPYEKRPDRFWWVADAAWSYRAVLEPIGHIRKCAVYKEPEPGT